MSNDVGQRLGDGQSLQDGIVEATVGRRGREHGHGKNDY